LSSSGGDVPWQVGGRSGRTREPRTAFRYRLPLAWRWMREFRYSGRTGPRVRSEGGWTTALRTDQADPGPGAARVPEPPREGPISSPCTQTHHARPRAPTRLEESPPGNPPRRGTRPGHRRGIRSPHPPQEGHQTPPNWLNNKLSDKAPRPDNLWRSERSFDMVAMFLPDSKGNDHGPCSYVDPLVLLV
jgi:hypothetical protein